MKITVRKRIIRTMYYAACKDEHRHQICLNSQLTLLELFTKHGHGCARVVTAVPYAALGKHDDLPHQPALFRVEFGHIDRPYLVFVKFQIRRGFSTSLDRVCLP